MIYYAHGDMSYCRHCCFITTPEHIAANPRTARQQAADETVYAIMKAAGDRRWQPGDPAPETGSTTSVRCATAEMHASEEPPPSIQPPPKKRGRPFTKPLMPGEVRKSHHKKKIVQTVQPINAYESISVDTHTEIIMAKAENTGKRDLAPMEAIRNYGDTLYTCDIDMKQYAFVNNEPVTVAYFELKKHTCDHINLYDPSLVANRNDADKLEIMFFLAITHFEDGKPNTWNIRALNGYAKCFVNNYFEGATSADVFYLSEKGFSKFLHAIRKQEWNPDEQVYMRIDGKYIPTHKLGDLDEGVTKFKLPRITYGS